MKNEHRLQQLQEIANQIGSKGEETRFTVKEIRVLCEQAIPLVQFWKVDLKPKAMETLKHQTVQILKDVIQLTKIYRHPAEDKRKVNSVQWQEIAYKSQEVIKQFLEKAL